MAINKSYEKHTDTHTQTEVSIPVTDGKDSKNFLCC